MTHRYVAGIGSGIALIVAAFYLEESNPMVHHTDSLLGEENGCLYWLVLIDREETQSQTSNHVIDGIVSNF